jgi:hypothetical protein
MFSSCAVGIAVMVTWLNPVRGEDLETLPIPREAEGTLMMPAPAPMPYRISSAAVWQYYGVDRNNQFRPRVAVSPYGGAYYLYDGSPYYLLPNQSRNVTTTMTGTPYR